MRGEKHAQGKGLQLGEAQITAITDLDGSPARCPLQLTTCKSKMRLLFFQPFVWEDLGLLHIQQEAAQATAVMLALHHCTNNSTSEKQAFALYIYSVSCSSFVRELRHLGWLLK